MANLIIVCGPQAVGKMTVAESLRDKLKYNMMMNHDSIEMSDKIFGFGTPAQKEFNAVFREKAFELAVKHNVDLIFTYVCAFEMEQEREYLTSLADMFKHAGGEFYFVELSADLETRLERNETPHRMERKASKRDVEWSRSNLLKDAKNHRLNSEDGEVWFENHIKIDNTNLCPDKVADMVIERFKLVANEKEEKEYRFGVCKRLTLNERPTFPKRAIVTAGMPYGNKNLHFGHVGGMFIHADIFARFLRDRIEKENVIFLSGTDCYGSPIMESYRKLQEEGYEGTLNDYVRGNHEKQKKTLESYGVSLDFFGASALGEAGRIHKQVSAKVFRTLYENGYIHKLSVPQFYDEEKKMFLNGRQVIGKCPIPGCCSEKAYADECSLGHQFLPSELINPVSSLSGKKPVLREVENWYFDLEHCIDMVKEYNEFLRKNTNTRKYQLETVEEFLKKPLLYVPRKYIDDLTKLAAKLPLHKLIDEEKKPSVAFEFETLDDRDKAKNVLDSENIHYTSGKTLVPFRLSGNVEWGVPFPECDDLKELTFWVWPESLWAPLSFTLAYLKAQGKEDDLSEWWYDDESKVYQFIGEDNIYFYAIAQTGLFTGLQVAKGEVPDMEKVHLSHIIANRHLLYMDTKASSSSEIKPPTADELLDYYTKDQLRMHFMSLGLSSKSVGFKPQVFMKEEERVGVDMVLKDGNLITNVFNRLIRTCFYAIQNNCDGKIPKGEVCDEIRLMAEKTVFEYERHMYNHDFHRISYVLDDFIRQVNKHWVNNVKIADSTDDVAFRKQLIIDCFYACKVIAILIHPIAPEGCEMFREYLNLGEELWDWNYILEPISAYVEDVENHELKFLEPRVDFFKKHECQLVEK